MPKKELDYYTPLFEKFIVDFNKTYETTEEREYISKIFLN